MSVSFRIEQPWGDTPQAPWPAALFDRLQWLFAILFICLGLGYSTLTPIFENSDETLHYPYVKHLADGQGLPPAIPGQLWNQEGTRPPLYYAIVAATTFWIDTDNLLDHLQPNPHWRFTEVRDLINDNQNLVLHGPMDAFPYRRAALAIHIARWWSLFFGFVTIICTFLIAKHLFPDNRPLTISATALTALTPQFIRVSATVSNDSLSAALASLTVLLALKFTQPYSFTPNHWPEFQSKIQNLKSKISLLLLGLLSGLALLTKLSSLTVFFLAAFIIFWRLFFLSEIHQRPLQKMMRWLLIIGVITAVLNGWWFVRNYQLYGEWFATETHLNLAGRGHLSLSQIWDLRAEVERAYWATLGWGQIRPPEWVYQLLRWFSRIGLIGLGLGLSAKLIQGDKSGPLPLNLNAINFEAVIFLSFWVGLNLTLYVRWVMEVGSVSHTRLIFPAITAISLLLALGWHALLPRRLEIWFSGLLTAALLTLNIYCLGWLIYPAFNPNQPANINNSQFTIYNLQFTNSLNLTFLDSLKLTGGRAYPLNRADNSNRPSAKQDDTIIIEVDWQTIAPMSKNYSIAAVLLAPDGSVLARRETYPGLGLRPTRYLTPGDTFIDTYPLKLTTGVSEPIVARAVVNLFDFDSDTRAGFPALDAAGNKITPIIGQIKIVPKTWPEYEPSHPTNVNFANAIALTGYDLSPQSKIQNPKSKIVTLYWQSLAPVTDDYTVFIHLLDANGNVIAQADAPPTGNAYPTSWWSPGETIADVHPLPDAPGVNRIRLGLYHPATGERLSVVESSLPERDGAIEIEMEQ